MQRNNVVPIYNFLDEILWNCLKIWLKKCHYMQYTYDATLEIFIITFLYLENNIYTYIYKHKKAPPFKAPYFQCNLFG